MIKNWRTCQSGCTDKWRAKVVNQRSASEAKKIDDRKKSEPKEGGYYDSLRLPKFERGDIISYDRGSRRFYATTPTKDFKTGEVYRGNSSRLTRLGNKFIVKSRGVDTKPAVSEERKDLVLGVDQHRSYQVTITKRGLFGLGKRRTSTVIHRGVGAIRIRKEGLQSATILSEREGNLTSDYVVMRGKTVRNTRKLIKSLKY